MPVKPPALTPAQAQALVERALATESRAAQDLSHVSHPMRYRLRKTSPRLTSIKEIVETRDGDVARLLSINDQPLSPPDEQKEQARLQSLIDNPSLQEHRKHSEDSDAARAMKVLRVLRLAGSLQQDKEIGLGIIGELDKGGWIEIDQANVGEHQWRIVHLKLVMNGRVLFKAKNSNSVQEYSEFQSLSPELSYKQAIQMLRSNSWAAAPAGHE